MQRGTKIDNLKIIKMDVEIITCPDTGHKVLFNTKHKICLHNETVSEDEAEVIKFKDYTDKYLNYLSDNGLDNDYNAINYEDLMDFVENHIINA